MFLTVEKRVARIYEQYCGVRMVFRLVRSERRNGRVRRVTVAYLGSLHEDRLRHPLPRLDFWRRAAPIIDALPVADDECERILDLVASRVPIPSAEEIAREREYLKQFTATVRDMVPDHMKRRAVPQP